MGCSCAGSTKSHSAIYRPENATMLSLRFVDTSATFGGCVSDRRYFTFVKIHKLIFAPSPGGIGTVRPRPIAQKPSHQRALHRRRSVTNVLTVQYICAQRERLQCCNVAMLQCCNALVRRCVPGPLILNAVAVVNQDGGSAGDFRSNPAPTE